MRFTLFSTSYELNLPNMHYPKQDRLRIYAAAQIGLIQIEANPNKQRKYIDFIDYYADLSEQKIIEFRTNYLNAEGEKMGLAQILR
jgi:thiaminase